MQLDTDSVGKLLALGQTFTTHGDQELRYPIIWQEPAEAVIPDGSPIEIPPEAEDVVIGPEPTVVMGESLYRGTEQEAVDAIAGFTITNDVTCRGQWPGRCHVDSDEIAGYAYKMLPTFRPTLSRYEPLDVDDLDDVTVEGYVDGETAVSGSTTQLSFSIPEAVSFVSKVAKLKENDLIALGDPGNCSLTIDDADQVTCYVEGIGELTNPVEPLE